MIKKTISLITLSTFLYSTVIINTVFAIAAQVDTKKEEKQPRIAVLPFTDTNAAAKTEGYGEAIAGMLMTKLINDKIFQVVERREIDRIMKEMAFQISGAVDSQTAKELGEVLGVDILVFGNVAKFDPLVETDIRLIDTQSGEALLAEHASSQSGLEIRQMVENLAQKIEKRYLGRLMGELIIHSQPSGCAVYIDGVMEGRTPLTKLISYGQHKIRVTKDTFEIWEKSIIVQEKGYKIDAQLTKKEIETKPKEPQPSKSKIKQPVTRKSGGISKIWIIGGVVVLGAGIAALILSQKKEEESKNGSIEVSW